MIPHIPYLFSVRPMTEEEGGGYLIEFPDLPGCVSDGDTVEEAITNGVEAMEGWIEAVRVEGQPVPEPVHAARAA